MERNIPWPPEKIRQSFLDYYSQQGCLLLSSLVPEINRVHFVSTSGQFASVVLPAYELHPDLVSVVAIQKCIHVSGECNELRQIGNDTFHHSFFEMLSVYSMGHKSLEQEIERTWKLLTEVYGLEKDRIFVTHYDSDEDMDLLPNTEPQKIWKQYLTEDRVLALGKYDHFWHKGDTNVSGPRIEIYYNRVGDGGADNNGRFKICTIITLLQRRKTNDSLDCASKICTGSFIGLERLAAILQNKGSNYETDLFDFIIQKIQEITGAEPYRGRLFREDIGYKDKAYRLIADHIRTLAIAISNGVTPGPINEGYILRRLIRRAIYFGKDKLNAPDNFMDQLVDVVVDLLGAAFPELKTNHMFVHEKINAEEKAFQRCYSKGIAKFRQIVQDLNPGDEVPVNGVVQMYHTYGFDVELQDVMAEELRLYIDPRKFMQCFNSPGPVILRPEDELALPLFAEDINILIQQGVPRTDDSFKYQLDETAQVCGIWTNRFHSEKFDSQNKRCGILLDRTNFYSGSGGQLYDTGTISTNSFKFIVDEVQSYNDYLLHLGTLVSGQINIGDTVHLHVDSDRRLLIMSHQTCSHLLSFALRKVMGDQCELKSVQILPNKFRLDFNSDRPLTEHELNKLEEFVNNMILKELPIDVKFVPLDVAKSINGICLKFSGRLTNDVARVVSFGAQIDQVLKSPLEPKWQDFAITIGNGTNFTNTRQIQHFVIVEEAGIARGERRIIGLAGEETRTAISMAEKLEERCCSLEKMVKDNLFGQLKRQLVEFIAELESAVISYYRKVSLRYRASVLQKLTQGEYIDNLEEQKLRGQRLVNAIQKRFENSSEEFLVVIERLDECIQKVACDTATTIVNETKPDDKPKAAMIFTVNVTKANKPSIMICCVVNSLSIDKGLSAKQWAAAVVAVLAGKSGGKPGMAQGRGHLLDKLDEAMKLALEYAMKYL